MFYIPTYIHITPNQIYLVTFMCRTVDTNFIFTKKSDVTKCFFDICNADGTVLSKIMKFGHSKSIFYVKKRLNLSKKNFIKEYQFRTTFFVKYIF